MDGLKLNQGIFMLASTNKPWEIDPAVRRRFDRCLLCPLPDAQARKTLFKNMLPNLDTSDHNFQSIIEQTEGWYFDIN